MPIVLTGLAEASFEDGGQACIVEVNPDDGQDDGIYIRVQSWVGNGDRHAHWVSGLSGKKVRVTVELVDE